MRNTVNLSWSLVCAALVFVSVQIDAQTLYKYVDKDGKVSYSDVPPKDNEKGKSSKITVDTTANVTKQVNKDSSGNLQKFADVKARGDARIALRNKLQADITSAKKERDSAVKALEAGREPLEGETRIIVGKNSNSVQRTPEYTARIEALENAVTNAEKRIEQAEGRYQRGAPD